MKLADYETFKFERRGRILTAIINRPDHMNAVNATMHAEMATVFYDLQKDEDSDVIVLTGAGRAFCAGGDTAWFQQMIDEPRMFEALMPEAKAIVMALIELEKPIICRLNGAAAGLGATIAAHVRHRHRQRKGAHRRSARVHGTGRRRRRLCDLAAADRFQQGQGAAHAR